MKIVFSELEWNQTEEMESNRSPSFKKPSPRDIFVQVCRDNQGLVINVLNNIFTNSQYIHSSSHVEWDGKDPLWSEAVYAKQWTLQPWEMAKRNNKSLGLSIPIEVQRELQALFTKKYMEEVGDRYTNTTLTTTDRFGLIYQFSIVDNPCITCSVTGPQFKHEMFYLDSHHISNYDWKNTDLILRRY